MSAVHHSTPYFPEALADKFYSLKERGFITPNMLSEYIGSHLMQTAALAAVSTPPDSYTIEAYTQQKTHHFELTRSENGAQTLRAISSNAKQYQIYFAGNTQDALEPNYIKEMLQANPNTNYIFWNYPGACRYKGVTRFDLLFKAGYEQVKKLRNEGIPPEDVTLYGYSMGGGIAAHTTKKLHEEDYPVNLTIERSFSSLSNVVSPLLYHVLDTKTDWRTRYARHFPLGTSVIAFALIGTSIGTALAGFITSTSVIAATCFAATGYCLSSILAFIPGLLLLSNSLNELFNAHAIHLNVCFDIIATTVGSVVALAGLIAGAVLGAVFGAILSIQLLFTDNPYNLSLQLPTRALLNTTTGEILSVQNIQSILKSNAHGKITIINSKEDEVIHPEAALNTGLGFTTQTQRNHLMSNITSIWYNKGDHIAPLHENDIDDTLTYPQMPPASYSV